MHACTGNAVQILNGMTRRLANQTMTQQMCVSSPMQCLGAVVVFTGEGEIKREGREEGELMEGDREDRREAEWRKRGRRESNMCCVPLQ